MADGSPLDMGVNNVQLLDATSVGKRMIAVGEQGLIVISDDGGDSWLRTDSTTMATLTAVYFVDDQHGWIVGHRGVALYTTDGGNSWTQGEMELPEEQNAFFDLWFEDTQRGLALGTFGVVAETTDGGKTWQGRYVLGEDSDFDRHMYAMSELADGVLIIAAEQGYLLRSLDRGETWEEIESPYEGSYFGAITADDNRILVFGMRGNAFRSDDAGDSWDKIELGGNMSLQGASRLVDGRVVLAGSGGFVGVSEDNGQTFKRLLIPGRADIISVLSVTDDQLVTFGLKGVAKRSISFAAAQ
ncbi:MAG: YCF48-related protein [Halopseudomonas sp.]